MYGPLSTTFTGLWEAAADVFCSFVASSRSCIISLHFLCFSMTSKKLSVGDFSRFSISAAVLSAVGCALAEGRGWSLFFDFWETWQLRHVRVVSLEREACMESEARGRNVMEREVNFVTVETLATVIFWKHLWDEITENTNYALTQHQTLSGC